jgi:hypothetical protein
MENNAVAGTVPLELSQLSSLAVLYLEHNKLTSTIPADALSHLTLLQVLGLGNNMFTGTLPTQFSALSNLGFLAMQSNSLTSTIPFQYYTLTNLYFLSFSDNSIHGTIPSSLKSLSKLQHFYGSSNSLTGHLSNRLFSNFKVIVEILLSNNLFDGTISPSIGSLAYLNNFQISNNNFSGSLPCFQSGLTRMSYFLVNNNFFSGPLSNVLGSNGTSGISTSLITADFSSNAFTGTIPDSLFGPALQSLALVSNCMNTFIPTTVCNSKNATSLALDGLQSAVTCNSRASTLFKSYVLSSKPNTIPPCVLALPELQTLHLSGNNFRGNLEDFTEIGAKLVSEIETIFKLTYNSIQF